MTGSRFLSPVELSNYAEQERFLKEQANYRAEQESDGKPMADNTKQFTWIVKIKENLEVLFKSNLDVVS